jgi:hypothetical protein
MLKKEHPAVRPDRMWVCDMRSTVLNLGLEGMTPATNQVDWHHLAYDSLCEFKSMTGFGNLTTQNA